MTLNPSSVLIYPGCRWTVQVQGGPETQTKSSIRREFSIADDSVAEIDEFGQVTGRLVGETSLTLRLFKRGQKEYELASQTIRVRVQLITGIEIPNTVNRRVFEPSLTRLNTRLLFNDEAFLHCVGPASYSWTSLNPQNY